MQLEFCNFLYIAISNCRLLLERGRMNKILNALRDRKNISSFEELKKYVREEGFEISDSEINAPFSNGKNPPLYFCALNVWPLRLFIRVPLLIQEMMKAYTKMQKLLQE